MNELHYGFSLDYLKDTDTSWSYWEIVRELVQNAMDEAPDDWGVHLDPETNVLTIKDGGSGLKVHQLIMGVSEKKINNPRGQFGEGHPLACLVATRLGLTIETKSGNYILRNVPCDIIVKERCYVDGDGIEWDLPARVTPRQFMAEHNLEEKIVSVKVPSFKIVWEDTDNYYLGTEHIIRDWPAPDFHLRFVGPYTKILHETEQYGSVLQQRKLFDKDIWVQDLDDYYYGYNLLDVKLNRDRNVAESYALRTSVGKLWGNVADVRLWSDLFMAIDTESAEKDMNMYTWSISSEVEDVIREAFEMIYGSKAVIQTNESRANHAKYLGAKPIYVKNSDLMTLLQRLVQTDEEYIQENAQKSKEDDAESPEEFLSDYELETLQGLRRIADKVTSRKVVPYVMSPGTSGKWVDGEIKVNSSILSDRKESLVTLIHEVAHATSGANDLTVELLNAIQSTASDMFIGTVWNAY